MPILGTKSKKSMEGTHPTLVDFWTELAKYLDFTVLNGIRTLEEQKRNVATGLSKTMNSMHLLQKDGFCHANDVAPFPQSWSDNTDARMTQWEVDQVFFAGFVKGFATARGINIRCGADWNGDGRRVGQGFRDLDHFELPVQDLHGS